MMIKSLEVKAAHIIEMNTHIKKNWLNKWDLVLENSSVIVFN